MADLVDFVVFLDDQDVVRRIHWLQHLSDTNVEVHISNWRGSSLHRIPKAQWALDQGSLQFEGQQFEVQQCPAEEGGRCLLVRREPVRERLMEATLNAMNQGIQLYDDKGNIQFFNRAAKQMIDIPLTQNPEHQHLLDLFTVDADYSTTLTALRTRAPVKDRFDAYKSTTGKLLATLTSALPVIQGERLLGAVTMERDMLMTKQVLTQMQNDQHVLARHLSAALSTTQSIRYTLEDLIGSSPQLISAIHLAKKIAPRDNNILIQGETGTGKEIFAQGIHALSARSNEKFVAVNCAAFPESLIEGMFFGTVKGAFTGSTDKAGFMEEANHGTLFLDELNSMSLGMQAKLLRVLQEKTVRRVGGSRDIPIDLRVISSCNENAYELTESGVLRKDLFYRLASVMVEIPPLRERIEDLEELVWHYIRSHGSLSAQPVHEIEPAFWQRLKSHQWPGNVRELFHLLSYALNMAEDGVLREQDLPTYFRNRDGTAPSAVPVEGAVGDVEKIWLQKGLSTLLQEYERHVLWEAYVCRGQNATRAAELLKISRQNFQYYMKKYHLNQ